MSGIGFLFAIAYLAVIVGVATIGLLSFWRGMRAQEQMAATLARIEEVLAQRSLPPE
jgi:diphthamide synthase (EF-2-diphthine--ammonia ligase)